MDRDKKEKKFKIKAYSKTELAGLYSCDIRTMKKWIDINLKLKKELAKAGYTNGQRTLLTPAQVKVFVKYIGEPQAMLEC